MGIATRALAALGLVVACAAAHAQGAGSVSADVRDALQWVVATGDHGASAFAVVDKRAARIHVFDARGRLVAESPVLLGAARGDHSVPGIGARRLDEIALHERTTPAGRFTTEPGRNLNGEHVVWFDYDAGLAIHRVRPGASYAPRSTRLSSTGNGDKRVSLGCVVVPEAFYDSVVRPLLGQRRAVVYVLPETVPVQRLFDIAQG
jgi:hypothetical protein